MFEWEKILFPGDFNHYNSCYLQEYEIDKTLGIKGPEDVAKMGIEAYNNECRKIVMRYSSDWEVRVYRCIAKKARFILHANASAKQILMSHDHFPSQCFAGVEHKSWLQLLVLNLWRQDSYYFRRKYESVYMGKTEMKILLLLHSAVVYILLDI